MAGFRAARNHLAIDGQSLCIIPTGAPMESQLADHLTVTLAMDTCANNGTSWSGLAALNIANRRNKYADSATNSGLLLIGGQSDLYLENNDGATVYADVVAYAQSALAAGFAWVIGTTIPPAGPAWYDAGRETARQDANVLILADTENFVSVVDVASVPGLDDYTSEFYAFDDLHWSGPGVGLAAETIAPYIEAELI